MKKIIFFKAEIALIIITILLSTIGIINVSNSESIKEKNLSYLEIDVDLSPQITNYGDVLCNYEYETKNKSLIADININYYIKAEDHSDVIDCSKIDNIAVLTLLGEENISISNIEIYITNDRKNFIKTEIIEKGIWRIGEKITIREIAMDDVQELCYNIRIITNTSFIGEKRRIITEKLVCVDNSNRNSYDFFDSSDDMSLLYPSNIDLGEYWDSYCKGLKCAESIAVEFMGREWSYTWEVWSYFFNISVICGSIGEDPDSTFSGIDYMDLIFKKKNWSSR